MKEVSYKTLENMRRYGGSFVRKLYELYMVADEFNRVRLRETFKDIFERYENFGR